MQLQTLRAIAFRNYARLEWAPHPQCTIFCGRNGQGKTNILEAICLLATARSHRGARDRDLTMWDCPGYRLEGRFENGQGRPHQTVLVYDGTVKRAECDGVLQERLSAVLGRNPVSVFGPEDLGLVTDGPADRRRFLDVNLSQLSAAYVAHLQAYQRALRQRNRALQDVGARRGTEAAVRVWDEPLIESGSHVQRERAEFVRVIAEEAEREYAGLAQEREALRVSYAPSIDAAAEPGDLEAAFRAALAKRAVQERQQGRTLSGPHRDDVCLHLDDRSLRTFGSQGQRRSVVLALKLAEGFALQRRSGTPPITLLDDFASELDEGRQAAILDAVRMRGQVLITTTELTGPLRDVAERQVVRVEDGTLTEVPA